MKRILSVFLLFCLLLAGCGGAGGSNGGSDQTTERVDVVLDWYPNAVHAFLYQAEEKGYFAEEGLEVNLYFPSNATDPLAMPAAGKADIGLYYQPDVIIGKANENLPVKVLGAVVQGPLNIVASLKEKGITTPEALVGKTIGHSGTQFSEVVLEQLLRSVGSSLEEVSLIDVGFDLMSAMTTGNVDATYGCFLNHEIPALEEQGFEMDYIQPTDYSMPSYYSLVLVANGTQLEENPDKYVRFLRACRKGFADMKADPAGSLQLMMEHQNAENFPLTESVEQKSFDVLLPLMETEEMPFLSQDAAVWQENIDWLFETGMIQSVFAPEEIMAALPEK